MTFTQVIITLLIQRATMNYKLGHDELDVQILERYTKVKHYQKRTKMQWKASVLNVLILRENGMTLTEALKREKLPMNYYYRILKESIK